MRKFDSVVAKFCTFQKSAPDSLPRGTEGNEHNACNLSTESRIGQAYRDIGNDADFMQECM
jgi:hypothetical protein